MVDVIGVEGRKVVEAAERLASERRRAPSRGVTRHSFGLRAGPAWTTGGPYDLPPPTPCSKCCSDLYEM